MLFNSDILDVFIGLFFLYVLGSTIVSHVNEIIAGLGNQRARQLEHGVVEMLGNARFAEIVLNDPLIVSLNSSSDSWVARTVGRLKYAIFGGKEDKRCVPSYIPSDIFARVLLTQLYTLAKSTQVRADRDPNGLPPDVPTVITAIKIDSLIPGLEHFRGLLLPLVTQDETSIKAVSESFARWFDQKMARVSGAYKRWAQGWILAISVSVAIALNLDTISMMQALWTNGALRHAVATNGVNFVNPPATPTLAFGVFPTTVPDAVPTSVPSGTPAPTVAATAPAQLGQPILQSSQTMALQQEIGLPIGWPPYIKANATWTDWAQKIIGLLTTALAFSLGAPFWFDMLSRISNLRVSGAKPPAAPTPTSNLAVALSLRDPIKLITDNETPLHGLTSGEVNPRLTDGATNGSRPTNNTASLR